MYDGDRLHGLYGEIRYADIGCCRQCAAQFDQSGINFGQRVFKDDIAHIHHARALFDYDIGRAVNRDAVHKYAIGAIHMQGDGVGQMGIAGGIGYG